MRLGRGPVELFDAYGTPLGEAAAKDAGSKPPPPATNPKQAARAQPAAKAPAAKPPGKSATAQ